jgi:predicted metalloprotease with PDZ domain
MKTLFEQLGLAYEEEETDLFDLGIRFNENVDAVVSVDPTSEAFRAGVREGDRVVSRSIYRGSISKEAELILEREGKQIPVAYRPVKKARVVQLLDNEANRARFRK